MIGAAITQALVGLRVEAQSMMTDTVRVVRNAPMQSGTPDPVTGIVTPVPAVIYSGVGRTKPMKRITAGGTDVGEVKDSQSIFIVSLPHTAVGIRPGDIVQTTASTDADLLTDVLRVVIVEDGAQTTARRLTCELVEARQ